VEGELLGEFDGLALVPLALVLEEDVGEGVEGLGHEHYYVGEVAFEVSDELEAGRERRRGAKRRVEGC